MEKMQGYLCLIFNSILYVIWWLRDFKSVYGGVSGRKTGLGACILLLRFP